MPSAAVAEAGTERWVLLDGPMSVNHIPSIMGCVVSFTRRPLRAYHPEYKPPDSTDPESVVTTKIVPNLYDKPISITNLDAIKESAKQVDARVKLSSILDAHASKTTENWVQWEANQVVRYDMENPQKKIERLWENHLYRNGVLELFKSANGKSLAMVTGILTCKHMSLVRTSDKGWGGWLRSRIPLAETLGDYVSFFGASNPEVSLEASKKAAAGVEAHVDEEHIFALAYDSVYLDRIIQSYQQGPVEKLKAQHYRNKYHKGDTAGDFDLRVGDQVQGDIYYGEEDEAGKVDDDEDEEEDEGKKDEYGLAASRERRRQAFESGRAVLGFDFDGLPPAYPGIVVIAGKIGEGEGEEDDGDR